MPADYQKHIATHLRQVFFGGNWTGSNFSEVLQGISYSNATTKAGSLNTIAKIVFHIGYYVRAATMVLEGKPLVAHDRYSYDVPNFRSEEEWKAFVSSTLSEAEHLAALIEQMPADRLFEPFADEKYGTYYRNLHGLIEHTHYHLGQIALVKRLVNAG
jgi:hypothetical protein